jgi:glycosyltransferase involved in cell wall biosynthesis
MQKALNRDARPGGRGARGRGQVEPSDVCLIVEGCYPFVRGGVSAWVDWLMRAEPHLSFSMVAIWPQAADLETRYARPDNLVDLRLLYLHEPGARPRFGTRRAFDPEVLADALLAFIKGGGMAELARVDRIVNPPETRLGAGDLLNSPEAWDVARIMYDRSMPQASFLHYFWAWRALFGGLFSTLKMQLPAARLYHTISTGYAGLVAARASVETGRPALITEHGIYTNERRIEILMADWIADTVDKGLALDDTRFDLRDMWINAFEAYAKACYEAAAEIITLYGDNQILQRSLGARPEKLKVIANGLEWERFRDLPRAGESERPTMALIGRVVPIKDVKSYLSAAARLRRRVPDLRALVIGPTDEDPDYYRECVALSHQLGLGSCVEFTGNVQIGDWLPKIHVVVLTSLSEAQPLVLLEAGAAGIPCVTTNVGSCAEILNGRPDEEPQLGPGGLVTDVVAPADIAEAVHRLLANPGMRRSHGDALRERVKRVYSNERAVLAYRDLYEHYRKLPSLPRAASGPLEQGG